MSVVLNDSMAKIAISKNLIKEYKTTDCERTVYLNNGTEFQIYLKNPNSYHIGVKIYLNDKFIGNTLVLKPGQSAWLERYLDSDNKFLFSTYNVENSAEMAYAISKNGKVKIEFYKERGYASQQAVSTFTPITSGLVSSALKFDDIEIKDVCLNCSSNFVYDCDDTTMVTNGYVSNLSNSSNVKLTASTFSCPTGSATASVKSYTKGISGTVQGADVDRSATRAIKDATLETGRVEKGSKSDQKFNNCDIQFEYSAFNTEEIMILPASRKQVSVKDTKRKYCSQCGSKVSPKDKFCSNCGAKL